MNCILDSTPSKKCRLEPFMVSFPLKILRNPNSLFISTKYKTKMEQVNQIPPLPAKKKKKKKKKKKGRPANDARAPVTHSIAKSIPKPPTPPKPTKSNTESDLIQDLLLNDPENTNVAFKSNKKPIKPTATSSTNKKTWSEHLPAPLERYFLIKKSSILDDDNSPRLALPADLERTIHHYILHTAAAPSNANTDTTTNLTTTPTFKRLNALYVTLERFGFSTSSIEIALSSNLGKSSDAILEWCCLHLDHDALPSGFTDKTQSELESVHTKDVQLIHRGKKIASTSTSLTNSTKSTTRTTITPTSILLKPSIPSSTASSPTAPPSPPQVKPQVKLQVKPQVKPQSKTSPVSVSTKKFTLAAAMAVNDVEDDDAILSMMSPEDQYEIISERIALLPKNKQNQYQLKTLIHKQKSLEQRYTQLKQKRIQATRENQRQQKEKARQKKEKQKSEKEKQKLDKEEKEFTDLKTNTNATSNTKANEITNNTDDNNEHNKNNEEEEEEEFIGLGSVFDIDDEEEEDEHSILSSSTTLPTEEIIYHSSLIYSTTSWTGRSPKELFEVLLRKLNKKNGSIKKKIPKFTQCQGATNYKYEILLSKDLIIISDNKPCRTKSEALQLCATRALYTLFPETNISVQLPLPYRRLFKFWNEESIQEKIRIEESKHIHKITFVDQMVNKWKIHTGSLPSLSQKNKNSKESKESKNSHSSKASSDVNKSQEQHYETKQPKQMFDNDDEDKYRRNRTTATNATNHQQQQQQQQQQRRRAINKSHCDAFQKRKKSKLYLEHEKTRNQNLPVMSYQNDIIQCISNTNVVVITGETGCGKSTQIPHILLSNMIDNYYDKNNSTNNVRNATDDTNGSSFTSNIQLGEILCTQPRRISATSLARRVSVEMGDSKPFKCNNTSTPSCVGYSIRGDSKITKHTILSYCTTGILLRRLRSDPNLVGVSVVIVDEVHERTVQSDFLMIALRNLILTTRSTDLKVLLMSATMNSTKVSNYFNRAPVLHIPGRTYPVSVQYIEDIIEATGFTYVEEYDDRNQKRNQSSNHSTGSVKLTRNTGRGGSLTYDLNESPMEMTDQSGLNQDMYTSKTRKTISRMYNETTRTIETIQYDIIVETLLHIQNNDTYKHTQGAVLIFLSGVAEITTLKNILISNRQFSSNSKNSNNYIIRTLHAGLSMDEQSLAFETPQGSNTRKIVLSTNIAETGVTIPDVVFVIDTLSVKEIRYNDTTKVRSLIKCLVPQSSAEQRRGRAGRVRNGYCFRLITRYNYDNVLKVELTPEILRVPLTEMCLNILVDQLNLIENKKNRKTPAEYLLMALDPPDTKSIHSALTTLEEVGAITTIVIDKSGNGSNGRNGRNNGRTSSSSSALSSSFATPGTTTDTSTMEEKNRTINNIRIEPLGFLLAQIPADVRIAKILIVASIMKCLRPALIIAASLSHKTPFVTPMEKRTEAKLARRSFHLNESNVTHQQPTRSDHLAIIKAYEEFSLKISNTNSNNGNSNKRRNSTSFIKNWCHTKFLSYTILYNMKSTISEFEGYLSKMNFLTTENYNETMHKHSTKIFVILASLASGLWPNVATITKSNTSHGLPIISIKNRIAAIHPSSINYNVSTELLLKNTTCKTNGFLCYHDLMQTSKCYLRDTSIVSVTAILLLCGNGSDAFVAFGKQHVIVNGWLKVKITSKAAVLLFKLRERLDMFLLQKIRNPKMKNTKEYNDLTKMMVRLLEV